MKKIILTGDRPTGRLHVGHYVGSLSERVRLQNSGKFDEIYIMIADAQALTDNADHPEKVRKNILQVALDYLACGIDPEKSTIFIQSMVPELTELTFYYMNLVTVSRVQRNPTVKAEIQMRNFEASIPVGFFTYPITLTGAAARLSSGKTASTGNMIIQGGQGSGKTVLATSMIKALQKEVGKPNGKIGKIEASVLNQKDVAALLKKVAGGCLIIEKAGAISRETAVKLGTLLDSDNSGLFVIMEDTRRGIEKALSRDAGFAARFSEKINIPIFTSDELVAFARSYANELGYTIDEMGVLALYNSISNIQKLDQATTLTEVKDIVDEAIAHAERGGLKKAFSIITSRRYDDDDYVILHEKDFGF